MLDMQEVDGSSPFVPTTSPQGAEFKRLSTDNRLKKIFWEMCMKFVIERETLSVEYKNEDFWKQYDEVEVEIPKGWYLRYVTGGIVHSFGYSQSSGRGEYLSEYREEVHKIPLAFTDDAKANAAILHKIKCDDRNAKLMREQ